MQLLFFHMQTDLICSIYLEFSTVHLKSPPFYFKITEE